MIWFTGCPHFNHANIIKYTDRPFADVDEMNLRMQERWNKTVTNSDLIYVLGDFAISSFLQIQQQVHKLNGVKILIKGNHDKGYVAMHKAGFHAVQKGAVVSLDGKPILLSHYPQEVLPADVDGVFHAHVHRRTNWTLHEGKGLTNIEPFNVNLTVELWDYAPVSYKVALKQLRRQLYECKQPNTKTEGRGKEPERDKQFIRGDQLESPTGDSQSSTA